jgi:hypothetical protein
MTISVMNENLKVNRLESKLNEKQRTHLHAHPKWFARNCKIQRKETCCQSVYTERRMEYPVLPKNRLEVHECLKYLTVETNKDEDVLSFNYFESGIIIFTCAVFKNVMRNTGKTQVNSALLSKAFPLKCKTLQVTNSLKYHWRTPLVGATCNFNHQIIPYSILILTFIS